MLNIPARIYNAIKKPSIFNVKGNSGLYPASASIIINDEAHGSCHRQEWYRWFKYKATEDKNPEYALSAMMGESLHGLLTEYLKSNVVGTNIMVLSVEQSLFDSNHFISGRTDIFLKDMITNKLHGCDIKTVGDYKAGMVVEQPDMSHILQCAIYLDQYNKSATLNNSQKVEDWIILYLARGDNYKLAKYPHHSPFKVMWQFSLSIVDDYIVITDQIGNTKEYKEVTMTKIYESYATLMEFIKKKELPPRDYSFQYSEETLTGMLKLGKLNKAETKIVQDWISDGAVAGELKLAKGDFQCRFCDYSTTCYSPNPKEGEKGKQVLYSIEQSTPIIKKETSNTIFENLL